MASVHKVDEADLKRCRQRSWPKMLEHIKTLSPPEVIQMYADYPFYRFYVLKTSRLPIRLYGVMSMGTGNQPQLMYVASDPETKSHKKRVNGLCTPADIQHVAQYNEEEMTLLRRCPARLEFLSPSGFSFFLTR